MFKLPPIQRRMPELRIIPTSSFPFGLVNALNPRSIKRGAAADELNWLTKGDRIELRGGQAYIGTSSVLAGTGKVSGVRKIQDILGTEQLFGTHGKKAVHLNNTTVEWEEIGVDLLGANVVDANGVASEKISLAPYNSPAGPQMWINSPNCAGFFKILVADPLDAVDQYDPAKNFKGNMKIDTNATFLWGRAADKTGFYRSYIDQGALGYTLVAESVGTGNGATKAYAGTLAFKATNSKLTCLVVWIGAATGALKNITAAQTSGGSTQMTVVGHGLTVGDYVVISGVSGMTQINHNIGIVNKVFDADTINVAINSASFSAYTSGGKIGKAEVFTDNGNGVLTSAAGGTGTINYATGAYSVTFVGTPTNTADVAAYYQEEDSSTKGIADFTYSSTRTSGQGLILRQDEGGGPIQTIGIFSQIYFCFHLSKTWLVTLPKDDTTATNLVYRDRVGIPNIDASVDTGDGIFYIDDTNPDDVRVRVLTYTQSGSQQIIPVALSNNLKLNSYSFDQAVGFLFGDYVLFACRTKDSTVNNRVLCYNRVWKAWDVLDYSVNCFEIFQGSLVAGDAVSNNFMTLFSGVDDFGSGINNFWTGNMDNMALDGLKKTKMFYVEGFIAPDQILDIYLSLDSGGFVLVGSIEGTGSYIDQGNQITIGSTMLGHNLIGGEVVGTPAFHYERLFRINTDRFEYAQVKYVARDLGYVSVQTHKHWDVRWLGKNVPAKYKG